VHINLLTLEQARELREQQIEELRWSRLIEGRMSIRQSIGRRVIAIGQRIAAEPSLELARSR
jgi:hypothetical protein